MSYTSPEDRARNREYQRKWRKANPLRSKEIHEKWRLANVPKLRKWTKAWRANNPDRARELSRRWTSENLAARRISCLRRRALYRAADGTFSENDIQFMLIAQHSLCAGPHCGVDISAAYSIDHMVPLSRGGSNWPDNLQLLCPSCNSSKRDRTMEEWLASLRRCGVALRCEATA